jgi:hypothetical protein
MLLKKIGRIMTLKGIFALAKGAFEAVKMITTRRASARRGDICQEQSPPTMRASAARKA